MCAQQGAARVVIISNSVERKGLRSCEVWIGFERVWMWSVECRVWSVECEVWSVECGVWSGECGVWSVDGGVWSVSEVWNVAVAELCCILSLT